LFFFFFFFLNLNFCYNIANFIIIFILYIYLFVIVIYTLGIYLLTQFTLFLSPQLGTLEMDIMEDDMEDEPTLPVKNDDEFKPFIRRLPEFKFWYI